MRIKKHHLLAAILFLIAFIILPTGTPEDAFTTVLFIKVFGLKAYAYLFLLGLTALYLYRELRGGRKK